MPRRSFEVCVELFFPHFLKMERYLFTNDWSGQSWFLYFPSLLVCLWLFIFLGAAFLNDFIYTVFQRCASLSKWYDINKKNIENSEPKKVLLCFSLTSGRKFLMVIMLLNDKAIKPSHFHFSFEKTSL